VSERAGTTVRELKRWTRRQAILALSGLFGAWAVAGCASNGAGSVSLKNRGGKFETLRTKANAGVLPERRPMGPNDMRPAE
jgi:hypothetical protein